MDKELDFDTLIPEHCPDIARIIKVDCTPFAESCTIEDGKGIIRGKAVYDVLYETDFKNRLRCCSFTQDFALSVILPRTASSDSRLFCDITCERIDCKLIGARRVVIRASLGAATECESDTVAKSLNVDEDGEIFFLKKTIGFDGRTLSQSQSFDFSEQLPLNRNEKCIGEIVCGAVSLQPPQISVASGRADIKTSASVRTLCEEENNDGNYYMSSKTVPISIVCENDAIDDFKHIDVSLVPRGATFIPELDQYGENRIIRTDFSVDVKLKINEPMTYTVAEDVFERNHNGTLRTETVKIPKKDPTASYGFTAESKLPDVMPAVTSILDASARSYGSSAERKDNGTEVSGSFIVTILACTDEGIHSFDFPVAYNQYFPIEGLTDSSVAETEVYPLETIATHHSDGSITVRIIAEAHVNVFSESEETFISEITKRVAIDNDQGDASLVFCYPKNGEPLWNIAKSYRVSPESVLEANPERFDSDKNAIGRDPIVIKC